MKKVSFLPTLKTQAEAVTTSQELFAPPEAVWQCLMFYEDVPRRPWPLLRLILPQPLRSEGNKLTVGGLVRCTYDRGYLLKRTNNVESARLLSFEVVDQQLGIERYARAERGCYALEATARGTRVTLTTVYQARLSPRLIWRPLERYLCHRLHRHILVGMSEALARMHCEKPLLSPDAGESAGTAAAPSR